METQHPDKNTPPLVIDDQFGISRIGKVRKTNQDAVLVDPRYHVYLLADGMGGHQGGEVASAITLDILHEELTQIAPHASCADCVNHAYQKANESIRQKAKDTAQLQGMGTTAICVFLNQNKMHMGHVGDSRIYILTPKGSLIQLTQDHSLIEKAGLDASSGQGKMLKNVLTRSVGHSDPLLVDYLFYAPLSETKFLICSDGLHGMVDDDTIQTIMRRHEGCRQIGEALVRAAYDAGAHDNVSLIVIHLK